MALRDWVAATATLATPATVGVASRPSVATVAVATFPNDSDTDPGTKRRRAKALALLAEHPNWRRVVIAEAGEPVVIGVAIRDLGYGELEIPAARYDARTLLKLMDQYSCVTSGTMH